MTKIVHIFIITFGMFCFQKSYGQNADTNHFASNCQGEQMYLSSRFDHLLLELKDNDSLEKFKTTIDSIRKTWFPSDSSNISFRFSDTWNLYYCQFFGSEDGLEQVDFYHSYLSTNTDTTFTSQQIFCAFHLGDSMSFKQNPLKYFPRIYERDDTWNAEWTAILPHSEYLIIRMVHSYPNGNHTSWYKEKLYYFRKTKY